MKKAESGMRTMKKMATLQLAGLLAFSALSTSLIAAEQLVVRDNLEEVIGRKKSSPKVSSDLAAIMEQLNSKSEKEARSSVSREANTGLPKPMFILKGAEKNQIEVYIHLLETTKEVVGQIEDLGVQVDIISTRRPILQAIVPLSVMDSVAALEGVREITRPSYSLATAGAIRTEADSIQGTNFIRSGFTFFRTSSDRVLERVDGSGTTIAVLSNSLFTETAGVGNNFFGTCNNLHVTSRDPALFPASVPELLSELPDVQNVAVDCPFIGDTSFLDPDLNQVARGFYGDIEIFPAEFENHFLFNNADDNQSFIDQPVPSFPEGAAMLEVVHDVAPGAKKVYADGRTSLQLELARNLLFPTLPIPDNNVNTREIDVIIDNLVYFSDGRFDGSSSISVAASEISRRFNIPYFVSVGGQTNTDYVSRTEVERFPLFLSGYFNPDPRDNRSTVHSWSRPTVFQRDEALNIDIDPSNPLEVTLVWDEIWDDLSPRADIDLDLYLVPQSTLNLSDAVAVSINVQNGSASNPQERLVFFGDADEPLALVLVNKDGNASDKLFFSLVFESGIVRDSQYLTHGIPGNNSDALDPVISVGHIDTVISVSDISKTSDLVPGLVPGAPNQRSFFKWYEGQNAPSVIGYGSVSTLTSGSRGFEGPSAAVAHLGAFASLLRHRFPQMTPARILELMQDTSSESQTGIAIPPLALNITPGPQNAINTSAFNKSPVYIRPNPLAIYTGLIDGGLPAESTKVTTSLPLVDTARKTRDHKTKNTDWLPIEVGTRGADSEIQTLRTSSMGLEIMADASGQRYGWKSPEISFHDPETGMTYDMFTADQTYRVDAIIGSNLDDFRQVPEFSVRAVGQDGSIVGLTVNSIEGGYTAAPLTIAGKPYQFHFTPEKDQKYYLEFYSENENQNTPDDSFLILRRVNVTELLNTSSDGLQVSNATL